MGALYDKYLAEEKAKQKPIRVLDGGEWVNRFTPPTEALPELAWNRLPDGEEKYLIAKSLLQKAGARWRGPVIIGINDASTPLGYATPVRWSFLGKLIDYHNNLLMSATRFIATDDPRAIQMIEKYNAGVALPPLWEDAFARYRLYFQQGQASRGRFTSSLAKGAIAQWAVDAAPSGFSKIIDVVVPVFLAVVGGMAVAGAAAPATASTTGTTATGTAATGTAATVPTSSISVGGVSTGISTGIASVDTVIGSTLTGSLTGGAKQLVSGGSATQGLVTGAQQGAASGVAGEIKAGLPELPKLSAPGYSIETPDMPNLDLVYPKIGTVKFGVPTPPTPVPPMTGARVQESPGDKKPIDWNVIAKVALPAIGVLVMLSGR